MILSLRCDLLFQFVRFGPEFGRFFHGVGDCFLDLRLQPRNREAADIMGRKLRDARPECAFEDAWSPERGMSEHRLQVADPDNGPHSGNDSQNMVGEDLALVPFRRKHDAPDDPVKLTGAWHKKRPGIDQIASLLLAFQ